MALDFVVQHFQDAPVSSAIQRFLIDMPVVSGKLCLIKQIHVNIKQPSRTNQFGIFYAMSIDPEHVLTSSIILDSTIFLSNDIGNTVLTAVGFVVDHGLSPVFHFPEGIKCPYTRLPFFVQHSNTTDASIDWQIKVFYEFLQLSQKELAIAVVRRGRGVTSG